jgi:hypothetical protein
MGQGGLFVLLMVVFSMAMYYTPSMAKLLYFILTLASLRSWKMA